MVDAFVAPPQGFVIDPPPIPKRKPAQATDELIDAMIQVESGGDPNAVSRAGAQGLMQIMPDTAAELGITDPLDPKQNIEGGTRYLNKMLAKYDGDHELALMAYNWGPDNVDKWVGDGRKGPVPDETRAYVERLLPVAQPTPAPNGDQLASNQTPPAAPTVTPIGFQSDSGLAPQPSGPMAQVSDLTRNISSSKQPQSAPALEAGPDGLPAGFVLDNPPVDDTGLPPGFVLDDPNAAPEDDSLGLIDTAGELGKMIYDAAVYHLPGSVAAALEGDDPFASDDWKDALVKRSRDRSEAKRGDAAERDRKTAIPGIDVGDVRDTGQSLAFSGVGIAAGMGAGIPAGVAGNVVAPGVGTAAGVAAGGAASGAAAYRMATNQFVRDLYDSVNLDRAQKGEKPLSAEEFQAKTKELAPIIKEYGLWEAVPEAISNVAGFKILTSPVKSAIGKIFGKSMATRLLTKAGALYGSELTTETITQMGQHNAEIAAAEGLGTPAEKKRDWLSAEDLGKSFTEVAPVVLLQTTLIGAGGKGAMMLSDRIKRGKLTKKQYTDLMEMNDRLRAGKITPEEAQAEAAVILGVEPAPEETETRPAAADQPQAESDLAGPGSPAAQPDGPTSQETPTGTAQAAPGEPAPEGPQETGDTGEAPQAPTIEPPSGAPEVGARVRVADPALEEDLAEGEIEGYVTDDAGAPVAQVRLADGDLGEYQVDLHDFETLEPAPKAAQNIPENITSAEPGTAAAPIEVKTEADIETAGENVKTELTDKERKSGVYPKAHVKLHGLDISIENPKGSVRSGKARGKTWSVTMPAAYGYIKRTEGADGDQVDVYLGPHPESEQVFVIEQKNLRTGKFDEHKVMLGFNSVGAARKAYVAGFSDGKGNKRIQGVAKYDIAGFKTALAKSAFKKRKARAGRPGTGGYRGRESLLVFISRLGGMTDPGGELRSMDAHKWRKPFLKKLIQESGQDPDKAREAAVEAGYLKEDATLVDFFEAVDGELRGTPVFPPHIGAEYDAEDAQTRGVDEERNDLEREADFLGIDVAALGKIDNEALKAKIAEEIEKKSTPETADELSDIVEDEVDRIAREVMADEGLLDENADTFDTGPIPGFEAEAESERQKAVGDREAVDRQTKAGEPDEAPPRPDDAAGRGSDAPESTEHQAEGVDTETTDQGEQAVIPDAESVQAATNGLRDEHYKRLRQIIQKPSTQIGWDGELLRRGLAELVVGESSTSAQTTARVHATDLGRQAANQSATEQTDQGEQTVLPGAERDNGKGFIEAQADKRIKGKKAQKPADEGLFDTGARKQQDIFDKPAADQPISDDVMREAVGRAIKTVGALDKIAAAVAINVPDKELVQIASKASWGEAQGGSLSGSGMYEVRRLKLWVKENGQTRTLTIKELATFLREIVQDSREQTDVGKEAPTEGKIEDFGEKIEGARKDTFSGFRDSLREDVDIEAEPLSKAFPQPNYEKLAAAGVPKRVLAHIAIMRDLIPNKPRKSWKLAQWADQVKFLRKFVQQLIDEEISIKAFEKGAKEARLLQVLPSTAEAIEDVAPADLPKAAQYRVKSSSYSFLNGQRYSPAKTMWFIEGPKYRTVRNPLSNDPAMSSTYRETEREVIDLAKKVIPALIQKQAAEAPAERSKYTTVSAYRDHTDRSVFLGFKVRSTVIRLQGGFETSKEAFAYRDENRDELQAKIDELRAGPNKRGTKNRPRTGESLRDGDVTPDTFSDAFGFRGVQFGNYVEGPRRQADLNRAYDALMDLADTLGIPPKAVSLNGSLGLAFGARGRGGRNAAAAHYEPGNVVINLTKGGGPGSLAHEWLHALDNYFAMQDKKPGVRASGERPEYMSARQRDEGSTREDVFRAWKNVEETLVGGSFFRRSKKFDEARSKPYWATTIEMAARAFERYIIDRLNERGTTNDYLANIDTTGGAYPTNKEMSGGIKDAYDALFDVIETRETERGVELFSLAPSRRFGIPKEAGTPVASYTTDAEIKAHPDYTAAKAGDVEAAIRFIPDVVKPETVDQARERFGPDVVYLSVIAEEATGHNAIPEVLARYYADATGAETATDIVQASRAFHTGARPLERIIARPVFDGPVQAGRRYVVVDDVTVMGGTLAEIVNHIRQGGGEVAGVVTLVNAARGGILTATPQRIRLLENRFGDEIRNLGIEPSALTGPEVTYLAGFRDADQLRASVAKAEGERERRLRAKGILPPQDDGSLSLPAQPDTASGALRGPEVVGAITDAIRDELQRIAPAANLKVVESLTGGINAEASGGKVGAKALGRYARGLITMAYDSLRSPLHAQAVAGHEAIHYLRDVGFFTKAEWQLLETESRKSWVKKHGLPNRPNDATVVEEGIAYEFQDWRTNAASPSRTGLVNGLFRRLLVFFRRLANALRLRGFQTTEDIFGRVTSGEVGQRQPGMERGPGGERYAAAWHGGPHDFDQFSTEKVGTGEGNQSFGWGLYFAGKKEVAEYYKKVLSRDARREPIKLDGEPLLGESWKRKLSGLMVPYNYHVETIERAFSDIRDGTEYEAAVHDAVKASIGTWPHRTADLRKLETRLLQLKSRVEVPKAGRIYQVELAPEEDEYLRWDLPLDQQSDKVKAALAEALNEQTFEDMQDLAESYNLNAPENATDPDYKGGELYRYLAKLAGEGPYFDVPPEVNSAEEEVSNWLRQFGIRGVKYLDAVSRKAGEGTYNYVIFDAADVKIEEKYALDRTAGETPAEKHIDASQKRYTASVMDALHDRFGYLFDPLGKLPEAKAYLAARYRTLGRIAKVEELARGLYDTFAAATAADQKAAYDYLTTKGANPDLIKDPQTRAHARQAKQRIDQVGRDLVRQGLLSREAYEEHRGEYLPRIYLKHLLGGTNNFGKGAKVSDLGYLKQRKDIPESVRKLILGEITDPGFLAAKGVSQPMRDMAILRFLDQISTNEAWILPESLVAWEGKNVSALWLSQEATRIANQAAYIKDKDTAAASLALARKMGEVADVALEQLGKIPPDYRQVPDASRYGRLRGMWVRKEIFNDLVGSVRMLPADDSIAERVLGHGGIATKATQIWKLSKVALNPPTQVRNFMSNGVLLHLSGVPLWRLPGRIVQAAGEMAHNGAHWKIAKKYGVTATTFSNTELLRIEREMLDIKARSGPLGQLRRMAGLIANFAGDTYQLSESLFKTAKIIDAMSKGVSEEEAALEAQKWLFDYSLVPPSVRYLRSAPVGVPFITFYTKAFPRILETAVTAPWRFLPYVLLPIVLSQMIADDYDVDDDDLDALKLALPEWMRSKSNVLLLPYKDEHGRWQAFDLGYMYPWGMYQELYNEVAKGEAGQALGTTGLLGGPLPDLIAAVKTNIDPFTKRPITNEFDPPARQVADMMQYLWRMAAPTWVTDIGFAGHMVRTLTGKVNAKTGEPLLTLPQSAARLFGTNIYPIDPEASRASNIRWMRYDIEQIQRRHKKMLRDQNLTARDRAGINSEYQDLVMRRAEQLRLYVENSKVHPNLARQTDR